jgi:hypothetical protein
MSSVSWALSSSAVVRDSIVNSSCQRVRHAVPATIGGRTPLISIREHGENGARS